MEQRFLVVGWVLAVCCCLCNLQQTRAGDVVFINSTDTTCAEDGQVPRGVRVSNVSNNSATVGWDPQTPGVNNDFSGYEVLYWPQHSSDFMSEVVTDLSQKEVELHDLRPFTEYLVAVRLYCGDGRAGLASPALSFKTEAIGPSAGVTNVSVSLVRNENEVNITWNPLEASHWNGVPSGYYVYVFTYSLESECGGTPMELNTYRTSRNRTHRNITVTDSCYRVIVFAVNHINAWGPGSSPLYFTFTRLPRELKVHFSNNTVIDAPSSSTTSSTPFLSSPYVYIIVGLVVAVIPIVLGIVLCKKARERTRKVQYCRGVNPFGDIQMDSMSPTSGSHLSPHPSNSRMQGFSPLSNHSPVTPSRPLLASPMPPHTGGGGGGGGDHNHREMAPAHFTMPPPVHSPTTPQTHFQQRTSPVNEGGDTAFMSRNFNLEPVGCEVFSPGGAPSSARPGPPRPRANTEGGGMPNPYEFPIHPGGASTLPRSEQEMRFNGGGGAPIPPPPNHAPPPLTQSSLEIFARVSRSPPHNGGSNGKHQDHHRGMPHRSFSTTHAPGLSSPTSSTVPPIPNNSNSMRMIRSAGVLHPVDEKELDGGPDYATVEPPDEMLRGKAATLNHYPPQFHHPPGPVRGNSRNSDELSSFSEMTADNDSVQLSSVQGQHIPPPPNYAPRHPRPRPGDQRESVFSETSTEEPSISSGSIREASPTGAPVWSGEGAEIKKRLSSSSITPTNSRTPSYKQAHHHPPTSPL